MNSRNILILLAGVLAVALASTGSVVAHDIPVDVTVHSFFRPSGNQAQLLVRVPLSTIRDLAIPTRDSGFIDLSQVDRSLQDGATLWISDNIHLYEDAVRLKDPRVVRARVSLPSDRSFVSWDQALAHVNGEPLPADTDLYWEQGLMDVLFEYTIQSDQSRFSMDPRLARLGLSVATVLRFITPDGNIRAFEFHGDPGLVHLDPQWHQATRTFVELGFFHILDGIDHLLFLLCLVIPYRRLRPLLLVVTSFTVAHSITLIAAAFGAAPDALWFPPLVEALIAVSIVYMAIENIVGANIERRWIITFAFGLIHGFGFSFLLQDSLQFAGAHLVSSLVAFNAGVELGQVLVLIIAIPLLEILFSRVVPERTGTIILSVMVAHTAWHWMMERGSTLAQFDYQWPELTATFFLAVVRWLMAIVALAGGAWFTSSVLRRKGVISVQR